MTKDLDLKSWDFATAVSARKLNMAFVRYPLGQISSSQGKVSVDAELSTFQLVKPCDGGMNCSIVISRGTVRIKGGKDFKLDGLKVSFDLPLVEITPKGPAENRHAALSFSHVGSGKGTGAGDLAVEDMGDVLPSPQLKLAVATLVVNGLRDNPNTEHIILARLIAKGVHQNHKPTGWHFYFDTNRGGEPFLCVLQAIYSIPTPVEIFFPRKLTKDILPDGFDVATAFSRKAFWHEVMVPALSKGFGLKATLPVCDIPIHSTWSGTIKKFDDGTSLADPKVTWTDKFTVDFKFVAPQDVVFKFNVELQIRGYFKITYDAHSQNLNTSLVGDVTLPPQRDIIAGLATMFSRETMTAGAKEVIGAVPAINVADFAALDSWFVEWPHLDNAIYEEAKLDSAYDAQFFGR